MPIQYINTGTGPNSGDGDSLRSAFNKINANFNQLYTSNTSSSIIIVSDVAPSAPTQGTFWYDTVSGRSYIYFDDSWIDSSPGQGAEAGGGPSGPSGPAGNVGPSGPSGPAGSLLDLTTVTSNIIPAENLVYDLGSIDKQWRSLYVGTGTIFIGGIPITVNTGNNTLVVGSSQPSTATNVATESFVIDYVNTNNDITNSTLISGTYTVSLNTAGSLIIPGAIVGSPHSLILAADQESYNIGKYLRIRSGDLEPSHIHLDTPMGTEYDIIVGGDTAFVKVDTTGTVIIGTLGNQLHTWNFNSDGSLSLPIGGHPIYFGPGNASIQSALGFHIRSDEGIIIEARDNTDPENPVFKPWSFGINGNLTFPDQTVQTTAYRFVTPPVSSTSTGIAGDLAKDENYFYVCTATNAWNRINWDTTPW